MKKIIEKYSNSKKIVISKEKNGYKLNKEELKNTIIRKIKELSLNFIPQGIADKKKPIIKPKLGFKT